MYKYCCVIALSISTLFACEFVGGVQINDPEISKLFATAEDVYRQDDAVRSIIEDLYTQYLCLLASQKTLNTKLLNDYGIRVDLEALIAEKKRAKAE
jgi:hypothetical protein